MSNIVLQSKLAMAKTLHEHGVNLSFISAATGLTQRKLKAEFKKIGNDKINSGRDKK